MNRYVLERVISVHIINDSDMKDTIQYSLITKIKIKDLIQQIKQTLGITSNSENKKDTKILLYHNDKITKESENIGSYCDLNSDTLILKMVKIDLNASQLNDSFKVQESLINELSKNCEIHNEKEINLCINCEKCFCDKCKDEHKDHEIICKKVFLSLQDKLNNNQELIDKEFLESFGVNSTEEIKFSDEAVYSNLRNELENNINELKLIIDQITKQKKTVYKEFRDIYNKIYPILLDYKEKNETLIEISKNQSTIQNADACLDFYNKYRSLTNSEMEVGEKLYELKMKTAEFKDILSDMLGKTKNSIDTIRKEFQELNCNVLNKSSIMNSPNNLNNIRITSNKNNDNYKFNKNLHKPCNASSIDNVSASNNINIQNGHSFISNDQNNYGTNSEIRSNKYSLNKQSTSSRVNLMNLYFSPGKDKKELIKNVERGIKERKNMSPSKFNPFSNQSNSITLNRNSTINTNNIQRYSLGVEDEIKEANNEESFSYGQRESFDLNKIETYYNIEIGTNNLVTYSVADKKVKKIPITNLKETQIKRFEPLHSTLNYKGRFYISGGYSSSKIFYKFSTKNNSFNKLADMPNGHCYHCLIGVNGFVFALSGFKSKKADKYIISSNKWESLPDIEIGRSWPGCVSVDDTFLLIFGGLCDKMDTTNNVIERINIKEQNATWNKIVLNFDQPIPFYFGVVNINNENIYLFGGKLNSKAEYVNSCYVFNSNSLTINLDNEIKLPNKDEFDGRNFFYLGNNLYGIFSSLQQDSFYIFDYSTKQFEVITYEEGNNVDNN